MKRGARILASVGLFLARDAFGQAAPPVAVPSAPAQSADVPPGLPPGMPPGMDARSAFEAAQKLFDAGKLEEAGDLFRAAYRASGSPNARLMAARCLTALGRLTEAYDEMAATSRDATARAESNPNYVPTRDAAATELALLERRVGKITVIVAEAGPGTSVTLNGAPLAMERLGLPVAVAPGKIVVELRSPSGSKVTRETIVAAAESRTLTLALAARPQAPIVIMAPPPPPPPGIGVVRIGGIAAAGVGAIGMGVFAAAGVSSNAKFANLQQACGGVRCTDPAYASTVDAGKTLDTVANAALTAGLVGLVAGGLMIALGGPKKAPVTTTAGGVALSF